MAIYTQNTYGLPGQRYGSFVGKEASNEPAGPHTPGILTQLAPYAISGMRYAFVAKGESAEPAPEVTVQERGVSGRRYRIVEDIDELCEELKQEERAATKDRKKLKILERKSPTSPVGIYRVEQQIQAVEIRLDNRLQKIEELQQLIALGLAAQEDDDDEEWLMLQ